MVFREMPHYHLWPTFPTLLIHFQMLLEKTNCSFPQTAATFQFLLTPSLAWQEPTYWSERKGISEWEKLLMWVTRTTGAVPWGQPGERVQSAPIGKGSGWPHGKRRHCHAWIYIIWGELYIFSCIFYMKLPFSVNFSLLLMDSQQAVKNQRDMLKLLCPDCHSQTEHEGWHSSFHLGPEEKKPT